MPAIAVAGGSVIGRHHRRAGRGCQDAYAWTRAGDAVVAAVCDGCGSGRRSEVGAALGARLWTQAVARRLGGTGDAGDPALWAGARDDVAGHLAAVAAAMGGDLVATVAEHFLFTSLVAVLTPRHAVVHAIGDGVYAIDDTVHVLGPFDDDCPPYLGYGVLGRMPTATVLDVRPAAVRSIALASDGAVDLIASAGHRCALDGEPVGPLSQFWTGDRYLRNPDAVRRRLAVINEEHIAIDPGRGVLERSGAPLADDTTVVVLVRSAP